MPKAPDCAYQIRCARSDIRMGSRALRHARRMTSSGCRRRSAWEQHEAALVRAGHAAGITGCRSRWRRCSARRRHWSSPTGLRFAEGVMKVYISGPMTGIDNPTS